MPLSACALHRHPDANATADLFFSGPVILPVTTAEKYRISFAGIVAQEKKILDLTGSHPGHDNRETRGDVPLFPAGTGKTPVKPSDLPPQKSGNFWPLFCQNTPKLTSI
jgi:hypothetical protein